MNKKGFTLVELIATITIMAILIISAVPAVISISNKNKANMYCKKIQTVERAAQLYGEDNIEALSREDIYIDTINTKCLKNSSQSLMSANVPCERTTIRNLAEKGYVTYEKNKQNIESEFLDPRTGKSMIEGVVIIYITEKSNRVHSQFVYNNIKDAKRCTPFNKFQNKARRDLYYMNGSYIAKTTESR